MLTTTVAEHDTGVTPPIPPDTDGDGGGDGDGVIHIVSWWQSVFDVLNIKAPHALCGVVMLTDNNPDARPLQPSDSVCPACQARTIAEQTDPSNTTPVPGRAARHRPLRWALAAACVIVGLVIAACALADAGSGPATTTGWVIAAMAVCAAAAGLAWRLWSHGLLDHIDWRRVALRLGLAVMVAVLIIDARHHPEDFDPNRWWIGGPLDRQ